MIKKFNEYIKESLLDKLEGPSEEEVRTNFLNGSMNIERYLDFCKRHKMIPFNFDELRTSYLNGKIDKKNYIKLSIKYNWVPFTFDELKNDYRTKKTQFKDFIRYCYYFNYSEEGRNELDNELGNIIKQIIEENDRTGIFYLKKYLKLTNTYIFSKIKNLDVNYKMLLSTYLYSLSGLKESIKEGADISYGGFQILNILKFEVKFNKKAQPLLDYILSSSILPKNYKDYLKEYFDGCEFKTIRTYKEFPGLVKNGRVLLYSDSIGSSIKYLTIHFDLYWTLHNFYNIESGIELNDNIHNFLVDNKLNIGLFKDDEYTSLRLSKFDDVNSINESLLDKLKGPTEEEVSAYYDGIKANKLMNDFIHKRDVDGINYLINKNPNKHFDVENYDIIDLHKWNIDLYNYFINKVMYTEKFYIGIIINDTELIQSLINNYNHIINYLEGFGLLYSCRFKNYDMVELLLKNNIEITDKKFKYLKEYLLKDKELVSIFNKYVPELLMKNEIY